MKKQQRNGYARVDRVKEQIMRELAELVRTELKDPRAGLITINDVEVTRDYSHATVYYTVLNGEREASAQALEQRQRLFKKRTFQTHPRFPHPRTAFQIRRIAGTRHEFGQSDCPSRRRTQSAGLTFRLPVRLSANPNC